MKAESLARRIALAGFALRPGMRLRNSRPVGHRT